MTLLKPGKGVTVIPGKLFLHVLNIIPEDSHTDHYFVIDTIPSVTFKSISRETGPTILPQITAFIILIKEKLARVNKLIHICCDLGPSSRVNTILQLCLFLILEKKTVDSIIQKQTTRVSTFKYVKPRVFPDFQNPLSIFQSVYPPMEQYEDTAGSDFSLSIDDVLAGIRKESNLGWYNPFNFDTEEFYFYLQPENGFMSWIVPHRLLVMAAPGVGEAPLLFDMLPLLRKWKITTIVNFGNEGRGFEDLFRVQITKKTYDCTQDSVPSIEDGFSFCEICDGGQPVAICSLAGYGRGPTFAALWLMHSFGFTAKEAIGWIRSVRQGSIYGTQQEFLTKMEKTFRNPPAKPRKTIN